MKAFVDASLLLDILEGNSRGGRFASALGQADHEWCVSPLVRMECRIRPLTTNDLQKLGEIESLISSMASLVITEAVFERAAEVRAHTGLKTPDAIHVATALEHSCAELWTADARIGRSTIPGLTIQVVA